MSSNPSSRKVTALEGRPLLSGLHQGDGHVCGQGRIALETSQEFLMVQESHRLERTVGPLVAQNPARSAFQHVRVDVDQPSGLGESLEDEGGEPQAAFLIAVSECGETSVVPAVS